MARKHSTCSGELSLIEFALKNTHRNRTVLCITPRAQHPFQYSRHSTGCLKRRGPLARRHAQTAGPAAPHSRPVCDSRPSGSPTSANLRTRFTVGQTGHVNRPRNSRLHYLYSVSSSSYGLSASVYLSQHLPNLPHSFPYLSLSPPYG